MLQRIGVFVVLLSMLAGCGDEQQEDKAFARVFLQEPTINRYGNMVGDKAVPPDSPSMRLTPDDLSRATASAIPELLQAQGIMLRAPAARLEITRYNPVSEKLVFVETCMRAGQQPLYLQPALGEDPFQQVMRLQEMAEQERVDLKGEPGIKLDSVGEVSFSSMGDARRVEVGHLCGRLVVDVSSRTANGVSP